MFKVIGGVVVCGFALYGLVKYLERPVVKVVIDSDALRAASAPAPDEAGSAESESPPTGSEGEPAPA